MKIRTTLTMAIAAIALSYPIVGYSITQQSSNTKVSVSFNDPESFTDTQNGAIRTERSSAYVLNSIEKTIVKNGKRYLPEGYTLNVVVTDIDLAGDYRLTPQSYGDYRTLRAILPPRIAFDYQIMNPSEVVVASGSANLTDLDYQNNLKVAMSSDKTAAYVNDLVSDWVQRDMRRMVKN